MESSTDTRVPPPSWINRDFTESALENAEQKKVTVHSMNVQYANPEGMGYISLIFRLSASVRYEDNEETQKKTLIVKTALESGEMRDLSDKIDVFKTEGEMLHVMMPLLHEQLAALEGDAFRPLAAKCYQRGWHPTSFLVLEDLSAAGFRVAQAGQPLDLKHCAVALRAYARLHAASVYVLSKQPHYREKFSLHFLTDKNIVQHMGPLWRKFIIALANEFDHCPGYEQYSERCRASADHILDLTRERMEAIKRQTKLRVLTHADSWKNNIMFKYVDGEVSEVRLVDFQVSLVASPAVDLVYFLYSSASEDVHRHHLDDLLSEYHSTLVGLLRRLGMEQQAEAYTLQELKRDMDYLLPAAVYFSVMSAFNITSEEHGAEFAKAAEDPEQSQDVAVKAFKNPYSLSYMKYLSPIFVSKGVL